MTESDSRPAGDPPQAAAEAAPPSPKTRGKNVAVIAVLLALVIALVAAAYWWLTRNEISTNDATIQAHIVQMAPRVSGQVKKVLVDDNQRVKSGQPLFKLDRKPFKAQLAQAQATLARAKAGQAAAKRSLSLTQAKSQTNIEAARAKLATAKAKAKNATKNASRYRSLYHSHRTSAQRLDKAQTRARVAQHNVAHAQAKLARAQTATKKIALKKANVNKANARIKQAKAKIHQARLNLSYTTVDAPHAGRIAKKSIESGSTVSDGQSAMALVETGRWVIANFKETQLTRMRPGQPVSVHVDAFPNQNFAAHVQSIQPGTGPSFSLLPPENATGNYVKVVKRVPVKIVFDHPQKIKVDLEPGMSVEPTVHLPGNDHSHGDHPSSTPHGK